MRELDKSFGIALRKCRKRAGISQEQLNFRTGVHRTYISEIERGVKSPTLHTVIALAEALGMKPSHLMRMAEEIEVKGHLT
ncbi:MAG: helix-turn-helix transcriptional regulator [Chloroflexota bacterium]|nr:helix-turn-helix transcriptional regulator [Chloroflexota bacterium]